MKRKIIISIVLSLLLVMTIGISAYATEDGVDTSSSLTTDSGTTGASTSDDGTAGATTTEGETTESVTTGDTTTESVTTGATTTEGETTGTSTPEGETTGDTTTESVTTGATTTEGETTGATTTEGETTGATTTEGGTTGSSKPEDGATSTSTPEGGSSNDATSKTEGSEDRNSVVEEISVSNKQANFLGNDGETVLSAVVGSTVSGEQISSAYNFSEKVSSAVSDNEAVEVVVNEDGTFVVKIVKEFTDAKISFEVDGKVVDILLHDPCADQEVGTEAELTTAISKINNDSSKEGLIRLISNIYLNSTVTIPTANIITLDLNGYVLSLMSGASGSVITNNGTLTITDSNPDQTHNFKVGSDGLWTLTSETATKNYEALTTTRASEGDIIAVKGGAITGGNAQYGGGINNINVLTITGGNIIGNIATSHGGGVNNGPLSVKTGSYEFTINGGSIIGNKAAVFGGGVNNMERGIFTLTDGKITDNTTYGSGGGVYNKYQFTMSNGSITRNAAIAIQTAVDKWGNLISNAKCGGVCNDNCPSGSFFTMNDGYISYNQAYAKADINAATSIPTGSVSATAYGGGVYVNCYMPYFKMNMNGGYIIGNTSSSVLVSNNTLTNRIIAAGGGVYIYSSTVNMYGGIITDNTVTSTVDPELTLSPNNVNGGGVYDDAGTMTVGGTVKITGNKANTTANNLYLPNETVAISTDTPFATGASIGITLPSSSYPTGTNTVNITSNNPSGNDAQYFTSDDVVYYTEDTTDNVVIKKYCIPILVDGTEVTLEKPYDGTSVATATIGNISGIVDADKDKVEVTVTAAYDDASVGEGKTITVTYTVGPKTAGDRTYLKYKAPEGETKSGTIKRAAIDKPTASSNLIYNKTEQTGVADGTGYTLSGTCKATNAGNYTATATPDSNHMWTGGSTEAYEINWEIKKATISSMSFTVTAPAKNGTPETSVTPGDSTVYTGSNVTWSPTDSKFRGGTKYTISFNAALTDTNNYELAESVAVKVNDKDATFTSGAASYEFEATAARELSSIIVKTIPEKTAYTYGETVNLAGLVLTCNYDDTTTADLTYSEGTGITVDTTKPTVATKSITISYGGKTVTQSINVLPLKLTVNDPTVTAEKTYNGNTSADVKVGDITNMVEGDTVTLSATADYNNKNVGTKKTITVKYSISGTDAGNYTAPDNYVISTGKITAKQLEVSGTAVNNKTYDGTTTATVDGNNKGTLSGIVGTENVEIDTVTASFKDKNAAQGKPVTAVYTIKGTDSGNYLAPKDNTSLTANIDQKSVSVSGTTVEDKTYDGTTTATVTAGTLSEVISGDKVFVSATGTFENKDAGTNKTVSVKYSLSGADATNYSVQNDTASGNITKRSVILTSASDSKEYDGKPLTNYSIVISGDGFASNEGATYTFTGTQTKVGSSANKFTFKLNDGTDENNYIIEIVEGILTVTEKKVEPAPSNAQKDIIVVEPISLDTLPKEIQAAINETLKAKNLKLVAAIQVYELSGNSRIDKGQAQFEFDTTVLNGKDPSTLRAWKINDDNTMTEVSFEVVDGKIIFNNGELGTYILTA